METDQYKMTDNYRLIQRSDNFGQGIGLQRQAIPKATMASKKPEKVWLDVEVSNTTEKEAPVSSDSQKLSARCAAQGE